MLLKSFEVAKRLKIQETTLRVWRTQKKGPPYLKLGEGKSSPIRYAEKDIQMWEKKQLIK
jgi:hypothetical protein